MAAAEEVIRCARCEPAEILDLLTAGWCDKTRTTGESLHDLLEPGETYKVIDGAGRIVGGYILHAQGPELWVGLAAGKAHFDLSLVGMQLIQMQAREFERIGFKTRRRGLVRKLQRIGFEIVDQSGDVFTMRKNLK